jgi:hypothetical protein
MYMKTELIDKYESPAMVIVGIVSGHIVCASDDGISADRGGYDYVDEQSW